MATTTSNPLPLPIRLAQTLGITTSLVLAGTSLSTSTTTIPRLLESPPALLLQQWRHMYAAGRATAPPVAAVAALSYFFLAYRARSGAGAGAGAGMYVAAGLLSVGIVPYTFAVMMRTNRRLLGRAAELGVEVEGEGEESAHQLVDRWGVLNLGRAAMLLASGLLGVWGVVG
ncbi:uncharacterized protein L3040_003405 [Drepanopeziza brunnea f. sp. 'multigermtubi']|uniref:DUF1772-domain-containing protein n=1 Tax=Marssonina brunnea f. sp. multigermtubi (strain MB_m1) TaxID=1072389 RepID=K1WES0_MARBU|nr:uncharacterized protein MBM_05981 [Drepanopeziza brunnea f. sp. 'multigermtubi' MB_m1]EKD15970.1 hypothetical protein MBM_05981 [Drepanopeziza brunnea f. sp. 'multigermtubi' MB_m1]KAJ5047583.1 hypothetical protein L3040_003405 [Drepanopeziza brunnea f. sp. 'multigermtubi']